jgi:hypothetical protein
MNLLFKRFATSAAENIRNIGIVAHIVNFYNVGCWQNHYHRTHAVLRGIYRSHWKRG